MLCINPAANGVLTYWCIQTAAELHSVFRAGKAHYSCEEVLVSELAEKLNWDAHVHTRSYFKNTEVLHQYLSETPEQIRKRSCLAYCSGRQRVAKNLPRRTDGSRRAQQLENSRIKGEPTLLLSRFPKAVENSGVILAFTFWIQRDCARSYLNSAFTTGKIIVVFDFN